MRDWSDDEDAGYSGNGAGLYGVRWTSAVTPGSVADVQLYLAKSGLVSPLDPYACEAIVTGGGWGKRITVDVLSHPSNEQVTSRTFCVEWDRFDNAYKPLDIPLPEDEGEYEFRLFFERGSDTGEPQFPEDQSDMGLPSELVLPVTVSEDADGGGGPCQQGTCPEGQVCVDGSCVPEDDTPGGGDPGNGDGDDDGGSIVDGSGVGLLVLAGGAAYAYSSSKRDGGG